MTTEDKRSPEQKKRDATRKRVEGYAYQCHARYAGQLTRGVLSLSAAGGAAFFAFTEQHRYDRWLSIVVVAVLFWEMILRGRSEWAHAQDLAGDYLSRAERLREASPQELNAADKELTEPRDVGPIEGGLGAGAASLLWRKEPQPVAAWLVRFVAPAVLTVLLVACAAVPVYFATAPRTKPLQHEDQRRDSGHD